MAGLQWSGQARRWRGLASGALPLLRGAQGVHSLEPGPLRCRHLLLGVQRSMGPALQLPGSCTRSVASTLKHKGHPRPWLVHRRAGHSSLPGRLLACGLAGTSPLPESRGGAPHGLAPVSRSGCSPGVVVRGHPLQRRVQVRVQVCCGGGGVRGSSPRTRGACGAPCPRMALARGARAIPGFPVCCAISVCVVRGPGCHLRFAPPPCACR